MIPNYWYHFILGGKMLKDQPNWDMPREKALLKGIGSLSDVELVAILLRTGNKEQNVLELAKLIIGELENITDLSTLSINELTSIKGVGLSKAITIVAAVELGKRVVDYHTERIKITSSLDIFNLLKSEMKLFQQEHFMGIYLNTKAEIIAKKIITIGSVNQTVFDTKELFKWAMKLSASAIIIVHNHPSGDSTPSEQDIIMTKLIIEQSQIVDIPVIDHVIIGRKYFSFREKTKLFRMI